MAGLLAFRFVASLNSGVYLHRFPQAHINLLAENSAPASADLDLVLAGIQVQVTYFSCLAGISTVHKDLSAFGFGLNFHRAGSRRIVVIRSVVRAPTRAIPSWTVPLSPS